MFSAVPLPIELSCFCFMKVIRLIKYSSNLFFGDSLSAKKVQADRALLSVHKRPKHKITRQLVSDSVLTGVVSRVASTTKLFDDTSKKAKQQI